MLKPIAKQMLEALLVTTNENTQAHTMDILFDRPVHFAPTTPALELAEQGILGGFLQAVVEGDLDLAYRLADPKNTVALDTMRR